MFCGDIGRAISRKCRKRSKEIEFWRFRGVKMLILARSEQTSSKPRDLTVGPGQIDPRGSFEARNSEICSYGAGYDVQNRPWLGVGPLGPSPSDSAQMAQFASPKGPNSLSSHVSRSVPAAPRRCDRKILKICIFNCAGNYRDLGGRFHLEMNFFFA